jgi:CRISPR/Cas system CSM-associated protein Csm5 (group 7 of RAMP superfamily)
VAIANFYRQLNGVRLQPNQALLQIGWGAGWDGKTFFTHIQEDARLFEQLVQDFRMHKGARGSPPRKPGDPFPRSRRVAMVTKERVARAVASFGWVLVELNKP